MGTVPTPRLVIAGTQSGVGKTTVSIGIMSALASRGLRVQPFKVGPDYIDPTYHMTVTGLPSRNLDSWMLSHEALIELFLRAAKNADLAVIEGVMGLFDGHSGLSEVGSTAEVAKIIDAPVILIIDAGMMSRSAGAVALGYSKYDPDLALKGFVINNIGSRRHYEWVKQAIEQATSLPVLGYLPKNTDFEMPERHLGLVPTIESVPTESVTLLREQIEQTIDLDRLLSIAQSAPPLEIQRSGSLSPDRLTSSTVIAYAWDEAFTFYYRDNLDLLEAYGATLLPFSPLHDDFLPANVQGVYIGGGFPELYAKALSGNQSMKNSIRQAVAIGMPVYGECGGMMYLAEGITDFNGDRYQMVGAIPGWSKMTKKLARMGYVQVETCADSILSPKGKVFRGHEFHWSDLETESFSPAYLVLDPETRYEGYANKNVLASYVHLHFWNDLDLARNFIQASRKWAMSSPQMRFRNEST